MGKKDKKDKKSKKYRRDGSHSSSQRSHSRSRSRDRSPSHRSASPKNNPRRRDYPANYHQDSQQQDVISNRGQPTWRSSAEQTRNLSIDSVQCDGPTIQKLLTNVSIQIGTSLPDQVDIRSGSAYIKYPSVQAASMALDHLKGYLKIPPRSYRIDFFPYRKIDPLLIQDWYCDKCQYKNFSRRNKCNKCDNSRNPNCKPAYNNNSGKAKGEDQSGNCSLMVRGPVVMDIEEGAILDVFEKISAIKDIRMIKNKATGMNKDFAFVEFFTPEETAAAFKIANETEFRINGEPVTVLYSKNRKEEREQLYHRSDDYSGPGSNFQHRRRPRQPREPPTENYSQKQREREIQMEKQKPLITMQQLKEKKQAELRKQAQNTQQKELPIEKSKRRQAQLDLKKWEKEMKTQSEVMYICPVCSRKFKDETELRNHETLSERHKILLAEISQLTI